MRRTNKKGFTIVELVIVIAVIAILAAVLIPNISRLVKKANESADIQAVRNMNTFLAAESVTGDVNSILDVYDLFVDSGYNVDSYSPLYSGRHFYYDKQYNQILYIETSSGKVLFPEERKNDTMTSLKEANHDLFSLSMEVPGTKKPEGYEGIKDNTITATVSSAEEFAYIIEEFNKANDAKKLDLTVQGTIDMMGAQCLIKGKTFATGDTIVIAGTDNAVIKNITSNAIGFQSNGNAQKVQAKYATAAIIDVADNAKVTIKNVTFENLHVKNVEAGSVALLIGKCGNVEIDSVTIKNSSVIGQRSVGALIGQGNGTVTLKGDIKLENVEVQTVGGRSGLLIGQLSGDSSREGNKDAALGKLIVTDANIAISNSKMSIYENAASEQKFVAAKSDLSTKPDGWDESAWTGRKSVEGQDRFIQSLKSNTDGKKSYSIYGFNSEALVLIDLYPSSGKNEQPWCALGANDDPLKDHVTIK